MTNEERLARMEFIQDKYMVLTEVGWRFVFQADVADYGEEYWELEARSND